MKKLYFAFAIILLMVIMFNLTPGQSALVIGSAFLAVSAIALYIFNKKEEK